MKRYEVYHPWWPRQAFPPYHDNLLNCLVDVFNWRVFLGIQVKMRRAR